MSDNNKENLWKEHEVCFSNWRFFVGLRFTVLAFFITLNSGLLYAFFNIFGNNKQEWFVVLPPLVGIISVFAGWIIENRNRQLYYPCLLRSKEIEKKLGYEKNEATRKTRKRFWGKEEKVNIEELAKKNSISVLLDNCCPVGIFSWMTLGIRVTYSMLLFVWLMLFLVSIICFCAKTLSFICKLVEILNYL